MSSWASAVLDLAVNNSALHSTNEERLYILHIRILLGKKHKSITMARIPLAETGSPGSFSAHTRISKSPWPGNRTFCLAEYEAHRDAYSEGHRNALPPLSQPGMESQQTTSAITAQQSPRQEWSRQNPIFLLEEELGRGGFGTVHKAVDVSMGDVYTAKTFHHGDWKKEFDILMSRSHVSAIIVIMIDSCLTLCKGAYCGIRRFLRGAETSAGDGISASWKLSLLSLSRSHH